MSAPARRAVEEHNGTVFAQDAQAIGPFSIAQFDSQSNGHTTVGTTWSCTAWPGATGGTAVAPNVGVSLNTTTRSPRGLHHRARTKIVNSGTGFNPTLAALLVGRVAALLGRLTILSFRLRDAGQLAVGPHLWATTNDLRAFEPATNRSKAHITPRRADRTP